MDNRLVTFEDTANKWEKALYAFLAEKEKRTGSRRTVDASYHMLQTFFGTLGKTPDKVIAQDVFAYAHGRRPFGEAALAGDHRRPPGLRQLLLPLPDPHGDCNLQPLRPTPAAQSVTEPAKRPGR